MLQISSAFRQQVTSLNEQAGCVAVKVGIRNLPWRRERMLHDTGRCIEAEQVGQTEVDHCRSLVGASHHFRKV